MGNSTSRPNTPGDGNSPHNDSPTYAAKRKTPRRKESLGGLSVKGSAVLPEAKYKSGSGQFSRSPSRTASSSLRGRSQTLPTHEKSEDGATLRETSKTGSASASRSKSPRPPLNVDTSSPAPADANPLSRTASSNQSAASDSPTPFYAPHSQFGRAPRLPLPIYEEEMGPPSPVAGSPTASEFVGDGKGGDEDVPRNLSVLSTGTVDDEESIEDDVHYRGEEVSGPLKPTIIEWKGHGEKIYVTGTFCGWAKKVRLHRNGPGKDPHAFSAEIGFPSGTTHFAFLIDGQTATARHIPVTVDYAGALVNWMTVPGPPGVDSAIRSAVSSPAPEARPTTSSDVPNIGTGSGVPTRSSSTRQPASSASMDSERRLRATKVKKKDDKIYHSEIPEYLLDWDAPDGSTKIRRANALATTHQAPPQLPPYMQKSILTVQTAMKDDASVLAMPNHTVLNHLATSSIKDEVLGTSATTRYKKKFVTTIMYMPTTKSAS